VLLKGDEPDWTMLSWVPVTELTTAETAMELITTERARQVGEEGRSADHDDGHCYGELAKRAAELAVDGTDARVVDPASEFNDSDDWGLVAKHGYRGTRPDRVRTLTIAGALIAAELDRVLREEARREPPSPS